MIMDVTTYVEKHAFGVNEPLPPKGFPEGRIRWRIRNDDLTLARVKTADGIREFHVKEQDGFWVPSYERGRNSTANSVICREPAALSPDTTAKPD